MLPLKPLGTLLTALVAMAQAQAPAPAALKFDVVSIKPSGAQSVRGSEGGPGSKDPTHYRFMSVTLKDLIANAYHVDYFQITSKIPLDRERFDLVANVPQGATRDEFRLMMRNLLEERFRLKAHIESKDFAAYELVVAQSGLKMKESGATPLPPQDMRQPPPGAGFPDLPPGRAGAISNHSMSGGFLLVRTKAQQEPISVLVSMLQTPGQEPVVDKTGLKGKYDFTLEYSSDIPGAPRDGDGTPPVAPGLFTAVQQQLGLQLVAKKLPFDVVVVESLDRAPTEN
jgi:uncharacterized protein (TIGR03435 family)